MIKLSSLNLFQKKLSRVYFTDFRCKHLKIFELFIFAATWQNVFVLGEGVNVTASTK